MEAITIKTPVYEGPLDLLLELIEKRKLLINDISLAEVTDEYIARLNAMPDVGVGEMAQFVSLAATLLLIKSRSLLPLLTLSEEETRDIKELEYRLAVYQIIKDAARSIAAQTHAGMLFEGEPMTQTPLFIPDAAVTLGSMRSAAQTLIDGFPQSLTLPKVQVKSIISIEEVITTLADRVNTAMRLSFKEFARSAVGEKGSIARHDIIVSFLALLELVKQGILKATQEDNGDITLESDAVSMPTYE
ncbi:MAG: scpA [Candidatus Adlerbacteria bacterium]|nr:scpA [Candidatus Adlerbacteria bacterium]